MQNIEPIQYTDKPLIATQISVQNSNDNLEDSCLFTWQLYTEQGEYVDNGSIPCSGVEYLNWDGNRQFPYEYVANNIGVILQP
jgi:hypothetical protein